MTETASTTRFRHDIQGLRATASLLIAVYHIWFQRVSGGVDVFFVLSGYLIIGSLTREADSSGTVRIGAYYTRIARRIFPAAYVILAACVVGTVVFVSRIYWTDMFAGIRAAGFYIANQHFASTSVEYLAQDVNTSPVQHFWAMSIQAQFYLVIPMLVFFTSRFAVRRGLSVTWAIAVCLAVCTLASFVYSVMATPQDAAPMYFNAPARIWEFGVGGLVSVLLAQRMFTQRVAHTMAWLGIVTVFANALVIGNIDYPGYIAAVPVLGAVCVLLGGQTASLSVPTRILSTSVLSRLGDYSYGFFMWHWPLLIFGKIYFDAESVSLLGGVGVLVGAFVLAALTYHLVESPFLRRRKGNQTFPLRVEVLGLALSVAILPVATTVIQDQVTRSIPVIAVTDTTLPAEPLVRTAADSRLFNAFAPLVPDPLLADEDRGPTYIDGCFKKDKSTSRVEVCSYGNPNGPLVVLVGGSHSLQWSPALKIVAEKNGWNLQVISKVTCRYGPIADTSCGQWVKNTEEYLVEKKPDLVITTASVGSRRKERVPDEYVDRWNVLAKVDIPIVAIRDNPWFPYSVPACVDEHRTDPQSCSYPRNELLLPINPADPIAATIDGLTVVDFTDYLCDETLCHGVIDNIVTYRDRDHLTSSYVSRLSPVVEDEILRAIPELADSVSNS